MSFMEEKEPNLRIQRSGLLPDLRALKKSN